ncbi:MAG: AIPR family protein [Planctomycetota bacterium]|jgi:hypothetical protein
MEPYSDFPSYLNSFDLLQQHIRGQLEGLTTTEKGDRFAHLVQRLVPQSEAGSSFGFPELNPKTSNDKGVDLIAQGIDVDKTLYIQSKLWVDRADTIDSVMSKFQAYARRGTEQQYTLFDLDDETNHFLLVTLSPLSGVLESYKEKAYSSKEFFERCSQEGRVHFVDGHEIWSLLKTAYAKLTQVPTDLTINFETSVIRKDNVYIGVISSVELRSLYRTFGDALFFENIRDFLGIQTSAAKQGRTSPNLEIIKTIQNAPTQMLSRNNGLVFGARQVVKKAKNQLELHNGSVVNGCQTTMCLVEYSDAPSYVLAKVVETADSWDITRSANYQTSIPDIDLELARYMRPQLAKRAATNLGVQLRDVERSAFQLIDEIYDQKVAYSETRLLYIGLFSRTPNNVFATNYTELMSDLIIEIHKSGTEEEDIFEVLFLLQEASKKSLDESRAIFAHPSYAGMFDRLYKEKSLSYRCLLSILALCGAVDVNIAERESDLEAEQKRTKDFLDKARITLKTRRERFAEFHKLAVKLWMQDLLSDEDDTAIQRDMYMTSKRINFTNMYRKLCMEADLSPSLREEEEEKQ